MKREANRCRHPMGPPWQGTRQPRKDTQNNVEKVPLAAGAGSNLRRLLARGYCRRRGEAAGTTHEPGRAKTDAQRPPRGQTMRPPLSEPPGVEIRALAT